MKARERFHASQDRLARALAARAEIMRKLAGRRVLIVEDVHDVASLLADVLAADLGIVVDYAETGREAEQMARENRYAVVLCDLGLPDTTGVDLVARLRELPGTAGAVYFLMSGTADEDERRTATFRARARAAFAKPIDLPRVEVAIRSSLSA